MTGKRNRTDLGRFEEKLVMEPMSGCWIWVGGGSDRYGTFYMPSYPVSYSKSMVLAHRASLYLYKGIVPGEGLEVMHRCDNGFCCNPHHLDIGTHTDNMKDMAHKNRNVPSRQVLTSENVKDARQLRREGWMVKHIAERFGIDASQMSRVVSGCKPHGFVGVI